jgi:uncharacterized damage-inducible protein DinB
MKATESMLAGNFRREARSRLDQGVSGIVRCLQLLREEEIWWRPNEASNSAGNIVLHLCGNVRQWIISGVGGAPDIRERDREFAERGPIPRRVLAAQLKRTVKEAGKIIDSASAETLLRPFVIQGFSVSGLTAISHVYEHFSYHTGQIVYLTKLLQGKDLRFTKLPRLKNVKKPAPAGRGRPRRVV